MTVLPGADPGAASGRVAESFARQGAMALLGATLAEAAPGRVEIHLPFRAALGQQHGFFHGGVVAMVLDSACGYAALGLMPDGQDVLTVEFKTNFLSPARGTLLVARGRVVRAGRRITVCQGDAFVRDGGQERHVAMMQATMMAAGA